VRKWGYPLWYSSSTELRSSQCRASVLSGLNNVQARQSGADALRPRAPWSSFRSHGQPLIGTAHWPDRDGGQSAGAGREDQAPAQIRSLEWRSACSIGRAVVPVMEARSFRRER
jgi:nicotinamidase-related amidase